MAFFHGSANAGALILMSCAWLLANAPDPSEEIWPYLVFGAVFIVLLAHLIHAALESTFSRFPALTHGLPLAFAAYWLGGTPYRWLGYACWTFAALYAVVVPRMIQALARTRLGPLRTDNAGEADGRERFDLQNIAIAALIIVGVAGLIMGAGLVTQQWGLPAGIGAVVLWPVTLIAIPWYAAIVHDGWSMLAVVYGGGMAGTLLYQHSQATRHQVEPNIPRPAGEKP
jgi:hypothetical protein